MLHASRSKFHRKGFTVIELLVVTSIIALMSALILTNYRTGERRYAFNQAVQKLVSDFRKAQGMAISGAGIEGKYCGYGIYINPSATPDSYIFYGDIPSADCNNSNHKHDGGDYSEIVNLPERIVFNSTPPQGVLDVFYKPPEPITYINEVSQFTQEDLEGMAVLEYEGEADLIKTIRINVMGLIQVDP